MCFSARSIQAATSLPFMAAQKIARALGIAKCPRAVLTHSPPPRAGYAFAVPSPLSIKNLVKKPIPKFYRLAIKEPIFSVSNTNNDGYALLRLALLLCLLSSA
jgi:hypothetical protein